MLETLKNRDPQFSRDIRGTTGQKDIRVFEDMAKFKLLVTYQLAMRTHQFISSRYDVEIGEVDVRLNGNYKAQPSIYEIIDPDDTDPNLIALPPELEVARA
jgi:hypothetical protein